jgi:hypothetical protein
MGNGHGTSNFAGVVVFLFARIAAAESPAGHLNAKNNREKPL